MSICYELEKWTMITLASIAISLTVGLVLMQYAHGITEEERQANREKYARLMEEDIKKQDNGTTGCIDHNLCGTPSPEFAHRRTVVPPPDPLERPNKLMCELVQGGYYYEDNGEPHCIVH